ncbi:MAG: NAD(P)-binding domain-containing protein, partial [Alistipes dispar]
MKRVVIIGSGNLAEALARAVAKSGLELVQIFARNAERARIIAELTATD